MNDKNTSKTEVAQEHQTEIFEYIRRNKDGKRCKVGIIVGKFEDNEIHIGWSKANIKSGDKFDLATGMNFAKARMVFSSQTNPTPIPNVKDIKMEAPADIRKQLRRFSARTVRYFKGAKELHMPV